MLIFNDTPVNNDDIYMENGYFFLYFIIHLECNMWLENTNDKQPEK